MSVDHTDIISSQLYCLMRSSREMDACALEMCEMIHPDTSTQNMHQSKFDCGAAAVLSVPGGWEMFCVVPASQQRHGGSVYCCR